MKSAVLIAFALISWFFGFSLPIQAASPWIVQRGYSFVEDAKGFHSPVGITFLNTPGPNQDDVLYLVSELRGQIIAVHSRWREMSILGGC